MKVTKEEIKIIKLKACKRIKEKRIKAIDIVTSALFINEAEFQGVEIPLIEPFLILKDLSEEELVDLRNEIQVFNDYYMDDETTVLYFNCFLDLIRDEESRLSNGIPNVPTYLTGNKHQNFQEIHDQLRNLNLNELISLEVKVNKRLAKVKLDYEYWLCLSKCLKVFKCRATVKGIYLNVFKERLQKVSGDYRDRLNAVYEDRLRMNTYDIDDEYLDRIRKDLLVDSIVSVDDSAKQLEESTVAPSPKPVAVEAVVTPLVELSAANNILSKNSKTRIDTIPSSNKRQRQSQDESDQSKTTKKTYLSNQLQALSELQEVQSITRSLGTYTKFSSQSKSDKIDMSDDVMRLIMSDINCGDDYEQEVPMKDCHLKTPNDSNTPLPRYYNSVVWGVEWNKYNQTHYEVPPKTIVGYKFNIFYKAGEEVPTFKLYKEDKSLTCEDNSDGTADINAGKYSGKLNNETCLIRFQATGYSDLIFRIVNKEWDTAHWKGYVNKFDNGVLSLWFRFKRDSMYRK